MVTLITRPRRFGKTLNLSMIEKFFSCDQEGKGAIFEGLSVCLVGSIKGLFNSTFKTNPYLERAVMTGITRVSKASIFSDLNDLEVVTTTDAKYESAFGFTGYEVFAALDEFGLSEKNRK